MIVYTHKKTGLKYKLDTSVEKIVFLPHGHDGKPLKFKYIPDAEAVLTPQFVDAL